MKCADCACAAKIMNANKETLECHAFPPLYGVGWPEVAPDEFCMEFRGKSKEGNKTITRTMKVRLDERIAGEEL